MTPPPALPHALRERPIAHRALHDRAARRPENSRAAIRAAIAAGYGIEIDLQLAADGQAMVFHDAHLDRLTEARGPLAALTSGKLGAIRLKDADEGIPTLAEVLRIVAGAVPLLIEIKDQHGQMGAGDEGLERATATALEDYAGPVAVMSFNPHVVAAMARLAPQVPRGLTTSAYLAQDWPELPEATRDRLRAIPDYDACGASFISHEAADLARPRVAELRAAGAAVLCWTIRSPQTAAEARKIADNITFEGFAA